MRYNILVKRHNDTWAFKNTSLLIASLVILFFLADTSAVHSLISHIGSYGYIGAFITGIFFTSTFTIAPASVVLFHLAQEYNAFLIALSAGAGGVVGDLLIFRVLKEGIFEEFAPMLKRMRRQHLFALFRSRYFLWLAPFIGALIIASPLPDEIGIGLMGLSNIKQWQFVLLTFALNTTGIFIIVLLAQAYHS